MAQENGGAESGRRTTAVKDNEEKQSGSGIWPFVATVVGGAAVGIIGSLLLDKVREPQAVASHPSSCKDNSCPVCLDDAVPTYRTRCCGKLIHGKCLRALRENSYTNCPFCRSRAWLG